MGMRLDCCRNNYEEKASAIYWIMSGKLPCHLLYYSDSAPQQCQQLLIATRKLHSIIRTCVTSFHFHDMAILVGLEIIKLQHNFVYFRLEMCHQETTA